MVSTTTTNGWSSGSGHLTGVKGNRFARCGYLVRGIKGIVVVMVSSGD